MYTYYDWHLVRELLILLVFCLFVVYAVLIALWQDRKAKRLANRMTEAHEPLSVARTMARDGNSRGAELQRA